MRREVTAWGEDAGCGTGGKGAKGKRKGPVMRRGTRRMDARTAQTEDEVRDSEESKNERRTGV